MRTKRLVLVAALSCLATPLVSAQSTVTVYGLLDAGFNHVSGLKAGSVTRLDGGVMEGSKLGFRGTEDLGGGYKAIFTLESRLELDTGAIGNFPVTGGQLPDRMSSPAGLGFVGLPLPTATAQALINGVNTSIATNVGVNIGPGGGRLFDRQSLAGVITPIGAFTLGRQYTPGFIVGATFDASQTQSSLAAGQVGSFPPAFDIRLSNTLQYAIQLGKFSGSLMYGAGEVSGNSSAGQFVGGMAMYKGDEFSIGFGHNERRNELGQGSLTNNIFGASASIGPGTIFAEHLTIKDNNPSGLSGINAQVTKASGSSLVGEAFQNAYNNAFRQDATLDHVGYKLTTGAHTFVVAYNKLNDKRSTDADTESYGITYTYALSKRTNLNAIVTRFNNNSQGQTAPGGSGFLGGVTASAGADATNVAFAIRHLF